MKPRIKLDSIAGLYSCKCSNGCCYGKGKTIQIAFENYQKCRLVRQQMRDSFLNYELAA